MTIGVIGLKIGMTRIFNEAGLSIPITVVEVTPNRVTQIRTSRIDGYQAIQVTAGKCKTSHLNKPIIGHYLKAGTGPGRILREFRIEGINKREVPNIGEVITLDIFNVGQKVDIQGVSKGKGFQGSIKRHNFHMQDATHGNSLSHRAPGSIGQCQTPGRVFKGKRMAGHMGNVNVTIQNLKIIRIDINRNLLLVKGSVPGANGKNIIVTPAVKMGKC